MITLELVRSRKYWGWDKTLSIRDVICVVLRAGCPTPSRLEELAAKTRPTDPHGYWGVQSPWLVTGAPLCGPIKFTAAVEYCWYLSKALPAATGAARTDA